MGGSFGTSRVHRFARAVVKPATARIGLHVRRYSGSVQGLDPWRDISVLLQGQAAPTIIDVGANEGQSAARFAHLWPQATIHSFEPSPTTFEILRRNVEKLAPTKVITVNAGAGSAPARGALLENSQSEMSSFLPQAEESWGQTTGQTPVDVVTLDDYCASAGVTSIDLLKTDTQGYDFEVLKGADRLLSSGSVRLVYLEMIFAALYEDVPSFDAVYRYIVDRGFDFVGVYDQFHTADGRLAWCDLLFMRRPPG